MTEYKGVWFDKTLKKYGSLYLVWTVLDSDDAEK